MSAIKTIAKNTSVLFISQLIIYLLGFLVTIYSVRYLGTDEFGILSLAFALTGIFSVLTDLGLSNITVREVARDKSSEKKYVSNIISMKTVLAVATFLLIVLSVKLIGYSPVIANTVYILAFSVIITAFSGIFQSIFQAYEIMEYISIGNIINSFTVFVGVLLAVHYQADVLVFAFVYLISSIILLFYNLIIYYWKFSMLKVSFDAQFSKEILIKALPLSIAFIFGTVHFRVDTIILSIFQGDAAVGIYNASYKLMETLTVLPVIYTTSIFPVLSRLHLTSKDALRISYERSFKYLIAISLPIAVGTTLLASDIVLYLYGSAFSQSILALQIVIWVIPVIFLNYLFGVVITSINRQNIFIKAMFVAMVANIILNLILIPRLSYIGAAIVTVTTETIYGLLLFYFVNKFVSQVSLSNNLLKPIIACIIMALVIYFVKVILLSNIFVIILIAIIVYFGVLVILKYFTQEEINMFKSLIKRS